MAQAKARLELLLAAVGQAVSELCPSDWFSRISRRRHQLPHSRDDSDSRQRFTFSWFQMGFL